MRLESPEAFATFAEALERDPRVDVTVLREQDYYGAQAAALTKTLRTTAGIVALLMGACATFGALDTMYTAVSARSREIATLRALGFGAAPAVLSVLAESLVLALVGGALGGALAHLAYHGHETTTLNWRTYSQVAFAFQVTPALLVQGMACALLIGLVGGLFPAHRAARLPIATALREA